MVSLENLNFLLNVKSHSHTLKVREETQNAHVCLTKPSHARTGLDLGFTS